MIKIQHLLSFLFCLLISSLSHADELIIEPDAGRAPLLTAIQHAKSSIDIVMYGFTDQTFINALIVAQKDKKNVRILLEPQPYRAANENTLAIREFRTANINLYWPASNFQLTHEKALILDHQTAMVLTFNLTHSSFRNERNFALVITDPKELNEIEQVFIADAKHQNMVVSEPHLVWSPNNSRDKIISLIRAAHSEIKIYAQDLSDYKIIGALAAAARTGIEVKVLLSVSPEKLHNKKLAYLAKSGVIIHNSHTYYIHAKVMIVDQERALIGSINFTKPSLDKNRELSVITQDHDVVHQLNATFDHDWEATHTSLHHYKQPTTPNRKMLRELKNFYYDTRRILAN